MSTSTNAASTLHDSLVTQNVPQDDQPREWGNTLVTCCSVSTHFTMQDEPKDKQESMWREALEMFNGASEKSCGQSGNPKDLPPIPQETTPHPTRDKMARTLPFAPAPVCKLLLLSKQTTQVQEQTDRKAGRSPLPLCKKTRDNLETKGTQKQDFPCLSRQKDIIESFAEPSMAWHLG